MFATVKNETVREDPRIRLPRISAQAPTSYVLFCAITLFAGLVGQNSAYRYWIEVLCRILDPVMITLMGFIILRSLSRRSGFSLFNELFRSWLPLSLLQPWALGRGVSLLLAITFLGMMQMLLAKGFKKMPGFAFQWQRAFTFLFAVYLLGTLLFLICESLGKVSTALWGLFYVFSYPANFLLKSISLRTPPLAILLIVVVFAIRFFCRRPFPLAPFTVSPRMGQALGLNFLLATLIFFYNLSFADGSGFGLLPFLWMAAWYGWFWPGFRNPRGPGIRCIVAALLLLLVMKACDLYFPLPFASPLCAFSSIVCFLLFRRRFRRRTSLPVASPQAGFTLVELVMVITLLSVLAAVAIPQFIDFRSDAKNASTKAVLGAMRSAIAISRAAIALKEAPTVPAYPEWFEMMSGGMSGNHPVLYAEVYKFYDQAAHSPGGDCQSWAIWPCYGVPGNPWTTKTQAPFGPGNPDGKLVNPCDDVTKGTLSTYSYAGFASLNGWGFCYHQGNGQIWTNSANNGGTNTASATNPTENWY